MRYAFQVELLFASSFAVSLICAADRLPAEETRISIDFTVATGTGSPYVFGGTQPRELTDGQWDRLQRQGMTFVRSQADLTRLVPCDSLHDYSTNQDDCRNPATWNWRGGIYGDDFAQRAIDRDMQVCLVIKNARWNRYPDAPEDEETVPRDLEVWKDVLRKIINRYDGGITYIELFNEVDRDPQLRVDGSPYSRKEAYRAIVRAALKAVSESNHPKTLVGGPAAAGTGDRQANWLLSDAEIRERLGFVSFHAFDQLHYPHGSVDRLREVLQKHDRTLPIVRSSFVPEADDATHAPGTTDAVLVAEHLVGALADGLAASGLWEIQNRSGKDDNRYWFDSDHLAPAAALWPLMSRTLGLGKGENRSVKVNSEASVPCYAATNAEGRRVAIVVVDNATELVVSVSADFKESATTEDQVESAIVYQVTRSGKTLPARQIKSVHVRPSQEHSTFTFQLSTDAAAVVAFDFDRN